MVVAKWTFPVWFHAPECPKFEKNRSFGFSIIKGYLEGRHSQYPCRLLLGIFGHVRLIHWWLSSCPRSFKDLFTDLTGCPRFFLATKS